LGNHLFGQAITEVILVRFACQVLKGATLPAWSAPLKRCRWEADEDKDRDICQTRTAHSNLTRAYQIHDVESRYLS